MRLGKYKKIKFFPPHYHVAHGTDSPYACQGGTRCPSTVAVDPPTIIGGVNSLCGTRGRKFVYHGRLGYRCTGLVGERPERESETEKGPPPVGQMGRSRNAGAQNLGDTRSKQGKLWGKLSTGQSTNEAIQ